MNPNPYGDEGQEFLSYVHADFASLKQVQKETIFSQPEKCAVISVDVTNGFCKAGALSSPRVNGIIAPIVQLMSTAWQAGVRQIVLSQDTHEPDAMEFSTWPTHCVRGTEEAEAVNEIRQLPFFDKMIYLPKNSLSSVLQTGFSAWLAVQPQLETFVVVGDCTDLCVYQMAMHLRLDADARQIRRRIIVPADCVQTYDFPTAAALGAGAKPHPGDVLHEFFLYHLALNGIEVVAGVK
ncbi:MAG: isochorismatase family cysteine hydrolase [Leptolinea sp.]